VWPPRDAASGRRCSVVSWVRIRGSSLFGFSGRLGIRVNERGIPMRLGRGTLRKHGDVRPQRGASQMGRYSRQARLLPRTPGRPGCSLLGWCKVARLNFTECSCRPPRTKKSRQLSHRSVGEGEPATFSSRPTPCCHAMYALPMLIDLAANELFHRRSHLRGRPCRA
jgi:hypothetical protein